MTEQPPHEIIEPKSLPENLPPPGSFSAPPNALEEASSRRTGLIAWAVLGLVFVGGIITVVLSWGDLSLPRVGDLSFEVPRIELPFDEAGSSSGGTDPRSGAGNVVQSEPVPEGMSVSEGRDAEAVGQSDKPAGE